MAAPAGNKHAEKWTLERTLEALKFVDTYSCSSDCLYLGHALSVAGYYDDIWAYWRRKWHSSYEVKHLMNQILQRFEVRLFEKMAKREIPAQVGMFALKHHYGWGGEKHTPSVFHLSYIEDEPLPEALPQQEEETPQPEAPTELEDPQIDENLKEKIIALKEGIRQKLDHYNELHPTAPLIPPVGYFDGIPPRNMPAIEFDGGYFLKG